MEMSYSDLEKDMENFKESIPFLGSGGSSGRAVGYQVRGPGFESQSLLIRVHPTLNGYLGLLRPGESRHPTQDPSPGSPMLGLNVGPTLLLLDPLSLVARDSSSEDDLPLKCLMLPNREEVKVTEAAHGDASAVFETTRMASSY
ncbi:hypothetical protein PoB_002068100 [Plakobranchus ocellatus]|uniref:Uncharacterized protein n=1 Tax=Plakobranchus ocellatus TaxID=259542 RepID=A0AAV3Z4G2_9GAST|nr:hypothetical protein PoB_002068100 [Plakobranchus ocellatus]